MATLEQQIQAKLDELNALKQKQRKAENQQKIILGSLLLKACETDDKACELVLDLINQASERDKKKLDDLISRISASHKQINEQKFEEVLRHDMHNRVDII